MLAGAGAEAGSDGKGPVEMIAMMHGYGGYMGFWSMGLSWLSLMAFWVLLVVVVYLIATRGKSGPR